MFLLNLLYMKKLFLLVLAYGMFVSAFAQPEISKKDTAKVSDKWVITPVINMKGVLGRLDINFPTDVERNILIYQQADNKFITVFPIMIEFTRLLLVSIALHSPMFR